MEYVHVLFFYTQRHIGGQDGILARLATSQLANGISSRSRWKPIGGPLLSRVDAESRIGGWCALSVVLVWGCWTLFGACMVFIFHF